MVVISFNTRELLRDCLQSVFAQVPGELEVVVVDNASADGSPALVRADFPSVRLIANSENVGYAAAINQSLQGLGTQPVLILNSDIVIEPGAVQALQEYLDAHPQAGMVAPQLILPDGSVQPTWRRGFSLRAFAAQQLLLDKLSRGASQPPPTTVGVEHLDGAALLVRGEALQAVGLMDEGYWMYCEDSDWCLRFRQAGWELHYVPAARMLHHHGASSRKTRGEMIASYNLAAARYFRLHHGPLEGLMARWLGVLGTALRLSGALLGSMVTVGQVKALTSRAQLFARALACQARWRQRWLQPPSVPPL